MGMTSTVGNVGSLLNSGLTQAGNQPGPGDVSIGMPYGPGYTQPNLDGQPTGPGNVSIGMPAGPGYMQPTLSSGGKAGSIMPSFPANEVEPLIGFRSPGSQGPGNVGIGLPYGPGYTQPTPLPSAKPAPSLPPMFPSNEVEPLLGFRSPGNQPVNMPGTIGMPAGPGYMQPVPTPLPSAKPTIPPGARIGLHNDLGQPSIGLPYGPGFVNPGGVPGSIKGYPTSPAAQFNTVSPIERQMQNQKFNQPTQPPVAQFNPAATMTPLQRQAMAQKATQQAAQTVGLRTNPKQPMTVYRPRGY